MVALKPPFKAKNMNELYKKVSKGLYAPIPSAYSKGLGKAIACMLKRNSINRPTANELLTEILPQNNFQEQIEKYSFIKDREIDNLLNTIINKFPKSNYGEESTESSGKSLLEKDSRSISLNKNSNTMNTQSTVNSSSLVDHPILPPSRYLAIGHKINRSETRRKSTQQDSNPYTRNLSYRDYGGANNDYSVDNHKSSLNLQLDKLKHKRADSSLMKLK